MEQSQDQLFQQIIDEQEGRLGIEEARRLGGPPEEALTRWTTELDKIKDKRPGHWKRTVVIAAIIAAAMAMAVSVLATNFDFLNIVETIQEQFTQFSPDKSPEIIVSKWSGAYLPEYVPAGYMMSDAVESTDIRAVEYTNSEGIRFTFNQYSGNTNLRIDTETAETTGCHVGTEDGRLVRKGSQSTLYWNSVDTAFSIVYDPANITDDEARQIAESVTSIKKEGDDPK